MVDSPHHHAEQRVAGAEELHFLRDKVLFLGLRLARDGCGNAARRGHLSGESAGDRRACSQIKKEKKKKEKPLLDRMSSPRSHQLTTQQHPLLFIERPHFLSACKTSKTAATRPRRTTRKIGCDETNTAAPLRRRFPQPASQVTSLPSSMVGSLELALA